MNGPRVNQSRQWGKFHVPVGLELWYSQPITVKSKVGLTWLAWTSQGLFRGCAWRKCYPKVMAVAQWKRSRMRSSCPTTWLQMRETKEEVGHIGAIFKIGFSWFSCQGVSSVICSLPMYYWFYFFSPGWVRCGCQNTDDRDAFFISSLIDMYLVYIIICKGLELTWGSPDFRTNL